MSMKIHRSLIQLILFLLFLTIRPVQAELAIGHIAKDWDPQTQEFKEVYKDWQEGIVLDPQTGDYTVIYKDQPSGTFSEVIFTPATKIEPRVKSKFKQTEHDNSFVYTYELKNGPKSRQNIDMLISHISNINTGSPTSPKDWDGRIVPTLTDSDLRLSWSYEGKEHLGGLTPGKSLGGFRVNSNDLPGVTIMHVTGAAHAATWLGGPPDPSSEIGKKINQLTFNDFVPRFAVVPRISVPNPFDAAVVLTNLQKHVDQDLLSMKLIDSVLVARLDRLFFAAIDAARRNNITGLRNNLKDIRHALKKEHEDVDKDEDNDKDDDQKAKSRSIDKLAAKVLDFDVKYILKRIGDGAPEKRNLSLPSSGTPQ